MGAPNRGGGYPPFRRKLHGQLFQVWPPRRLVQLRTGCLPALRGQSCQQRVVFDLHFLPSTLLAYFQPGGLRLTAVFPFITLPPGPARMVGGIVLNGRDHVASVPSSMPLLFTANLWGLISAFRPRPVGRSNVLRVVLLAAMTGCVAVMIFGWIFYHYVADFLPFLILASAVGMVDVWRRLEVSHQNNPLLRAGNSDCPRGLLYCGEYGYLHYAPGGVVR